MCYHHSLIQLQLSSGFQPYISILTTDFHPIIPFHLNKRSILQVLSVQVPGTSSMDIASKQLIQVNYKIYHAVNKLPRSSTMARPKSNITVTWQMTSHCGLLTSGSLIMLDFGLISNSCVSFQRQVRQHLSISATSFNSTTPFYLNHIFPFNCTFPSIMLLANNPYVLPWLILTRVCL